MERCFQNQINKCYIRALILQKLETTESSNFGFFNIVLLQLKLKQRHLGRPALNIKFVMELRFLTVFWNFFTTKLLFWHFERMKIIDSRLIIALYGFQRHSMAFNSFLWLSIAFVGYNYLMHRRTENFLMILL